MPDYKKLAKGLNSAIRAAESEASALQKMKGTQDALPAAEREANKAKFLKPSKVQERLYHGTKAHDDYADQPGQAFEQFTGRPTWLAQEPYTASGYSGGSGSTYPVFTQVVKPLNLRFDANDDASKAFAAAKRLGVDVEHIKRMNKPEKAWEVINNPMFIDAVEKAGYDALAINEGGYKTFGVLDPRKIKSAIGNRGTYDMTNPDINKARGGLARFNKGGKTGAVLDIAKAIEKASQEADAVMEAQRLAKAEERAAAGRKAADVTKATAPMKMSEALGNMNLEGKGNLKVTQSDRTRVGGGNIGGAMFPGLQQVDPLYEGAVWGVGNKPTASGLIRQSDENTLWSTILGSADQLKTNPIVFNKLRRGFTDAMKEGKLSDELAAKINQNLALKFGEGADIRDPKIWQKANTFDKRALLADVMMGQGVAPGKGGVALGGEKSGKGVIFAPTDILKRETEPLLLHPEHGGNVPTFAVGPRLFTLSGDVKQRPDLHPGFPVILQGEDKGVVFRPAPGEIAMRDYAKRFKERNKRSPGYYDWTLGEKGVGLPSQPITEEYLTYLQKLGHKKGGAVHKIKAFSDDETAKRYREEMLGEINKANGGEIKKLAWKATPPMKMAQGGAPNLGPTTEHTMPDPGDAGRMNYERGYAPGGWAKAGKAIQKAAQEAGMAKPQTAEKDLTTLQDFHTSLGDRIRAEAELTRRMIEGFDYKYDKGQRVFTKDSAAKNRAPYEILERTRVGNQLVREGDNPIGKVLRDESGKARRTPYEPGYRVKGEIGEMILPASAILGDVEMRRGGLAHFEEGGTADKAKLMAGILARMAKDQGKEEIASLRKPRAATDLLNKGMVASTVGAPVDIMNMGLEGVDALRGLASGKPVENRLASDKPFLGSEHLKELMKQYGMVSDEERPMMETALSIASPGAAVKGAVKGAKAIPKAASAVGGGLSAAPALLRR
jgi:hypothetical protein